MPCTAASNSRPQQAPARSAYMRGLGIRFYAWPLQDMHGCFGKTNRSHSVHPHGKYHSSYQTRFGMCSINVRPPSAGLDSISAHSSYACAHSCGRSSVLSHSTVHTCMCMSIPSPHAGPRNGPIPTPRPDPRHLLAPRGGAVDPAGISPCPTPPV